MKEFEQNIKAGAFYILFLFGYLLAANQGAKHHNAKNFLQAAEQNIDSLSVQIDTLSAQRTRLILQLKEIQLWTRQADAFIAQLKAAQPETVTQTEYIYINPPQSTALQTVAQNTTSEPSDTTSEPNLKLTVGERFAELYPFTTGFLRTFRILK